MLVLETTHDVTGRVKYSRNLGKECPTSWSKLPDSSAENHLGNASFSLGSITSTIDTIAASNASPNIVSCAQDHFICVDSYSHLLVVAAFANDPLHARGPE